MCGLFGMCSPRGERVDVSEQALVRMASALSHRGPDGSGVWRGDNLVLGHTRLAVIDPGPRGAQPMVTPDGRYRLVYNGELYNDAELREELVEGGFAPEGFHTTCDTETVLLALAAWGIEALDRMRGMFALAFYDHRADRLLLARDPLGIKPLYYHVGEREVRFASEIPALLAHPGVEVRPNLAMVSAYLTTIRTVLGRNTLFEGVHAVRPGEVVEFDAARGRLAAHEYYEAPRNDARTWSEEEAREATRAVLGDSLQRHLRADVPVCALLSGGLDSAILTRLVTDVRTEGIALHTFCAGAEDSPDFGPAARLAAELGTTHHAIPCTADDFARDWPEMVAALGVPLSTPNEVAIRRVSRSLSDAGFVVALSGEGADELFGGYGPALEHALRHEADPGDTRSGGRFHLEAGAWAALPFKEHLLVPDLWASLEGDGALVAHYEEEFQRCRDEAGADAPPEEAHLRFQRKNNLPVLLQRLDSASMLTSVEGRTPFADRAVLELAESLPFGLKYRDGGDAATAGKHVLREAFRGVLPTEILERPKASFPLPFEGWLASAAGALERSHFARSIFQEGMRGEIGANPGRWPQLAWPMLNLALWGERWWA